MPETQIQRTTNASTPIADAFGTDPDRSQSTIEPAVVAADIASISDDVPAMPQPVLREPRPCQPTDPILVLVYRALDASFDALQRELPRVWREDTVSGVHHMRTATRRTRAVLRTFREILPRQATRSLTDEAAWLASELGVQRDLDVHIAQVEQARARMAPGLQTDLEPYVGHVYALRSAAHRRVLGSLASERFVRLSTEFASYLDQGPSAAALRRSRGMSAREGAERFALRALRRIRKAGRHIERDAQPERLHRLRLRCKRMRYLLESFAPLYGERLDGAIKSLKRVQDGLGDERDLSAAVIRLRTYADLLPGPGAIDVDAESPATRCRAACHELARLLELEAVRARHRFARAWRHFDERVRKRRLRRVLRRTRHAAHAGIDR